MLYGFVQSIYSNKIVDFNASKELLLCNFVAMDIIRGTIISLNSENETVKLYIFL